MLNGIDEIDLTAPDAKEQINKLAEGLINKKQELENKIANKDTLTASERAKLSELEQFKSQAEIKSAEDAQNWEKATQLKQEAWQKEKDLLAQENTGYKSQLETLLIDNGLSSQLDAAGVDPLLKVGALALLKSSATIADGQAMIGDKSLSDAVSEWAASDVGKAFCLAAKNSGGDGLGGNQTPSSKPLTLTEQAIQANKQARIN